MSLIVYDYYIPSDSFPVVKTKQTRSILENNYSFYTKKKACI